MQLRTSIAGVMALNSVIAVALAAFKNPSMWWASAVFTFEVALLSGALLGGILSKCRNRARLLGFAIFGLCYIHVNYSMVNFKDRYLFPPLFIEVVLLTVVGSLDHTFFQFEDEARNTYVTQVIFCIGGLVFAAIGALCGALYGHWQEKRITGARSGRPVARVLTTPDRDCRLRAFRSSALACHFFAPRPR
jgi:hypothetical protein